MKTNICKNCNSPIEGNYCSNCGRPATLKKIDGDYIMHEIADTLFANKGFFYTTKRMILNPGEFVRQYITEDRSRHAQPVTYLFITALFFTVVKHFFKIDYLAQFDTSATPTISYVNQWMMENIGYTSIIIGLYLAFWLKLFFKKSGYNLFEIFILLCYVTGVQVLFESVVSILFSLMHWDFILISISISNIYSFWAIGQFFEKGKAKSYIKAFLAFIVGMFVIGFIAMIGAIIEVLIRQ